MPLPNYEIIERKNFACTAEARANYIKDGYVPLVEGRYDLYRKHEGDKTYEVWIRKVGFLDVATTVIEIT